MKLLILLTLIFFMPQEPKIVTCTVVDDQSVACPEGGKMVLFRFDDAATAKQIFDEWRLVAPLQNGSVNADAPLGTQEIKAGDKVKATITDDRFRSIAACEVRVWRNIKLWQQQGLRQGERPPAGLNTLPDDCQPGTK